MSSSPPFAELFSQKRPFFSERHLFSIKLKEIITKLNLKALGSVRVGVGRALLSQ